MKKYYLLLLFLSFNGVLSAQLLDISRFQPFVLSTTINPANTGQFTDKHMLQWFQIQSNNQFDYDDKWTFFNSKLQMDFQIPVFRKDYIGIGGHYNLRKSLNDFSYDNAYHLRFSYQKHLSRRARNILSIGINTGARDANALSNRKWFYNPDHGFSWIHRSSRGTNKYFYQFGLSHKMQYSLSNTTHLVTDSIVVNSWKHWVRFEAYGEWGLSRRIQLNALANYQYRFYGEKTFGKHSLGGTISMLYNIGKRYQHHQLIFGTGLQFIGWDLDQKIRLTYNFFLGVNIGNTRIMGHFSFYSSPSTIILSSLRIAYQLGLSLTYNISHRGLGGTPTW